MQVSGRLPVFFCILLFTQSRQRLDYALYGTYLSGFKEYNKPTGSGAVITPTTG
jgi:hypothetical protein